MYLVTGDFILLRFFYLSNTLISREHFKAKDPERSKAKPEETCLEVMERECHAIFANTLFNAVLLGANNGSELLQGWTGVVPPAAPGIPGHADGARQFQSLSAPRLSTAESYCQHGHYTWGSVPERVSDALIRDSTNIAASGHEMDRKKISCTVNRMFT